MAATPGETAAGMTEKPKESTFISGVDLRCKTNNVAHHTDEISEEKLIVRRGQPFNMTLNLKNAFNPKRHSLTFKAATGEKPTEWQGTMSFFSIPDRGVQSKSAKAVWKVEIQKDSTLVTGLLVLTVTPPADCPIGEFDLSEKLGEEYNLLAKLVVLYNPWCPDDWVYMKDLKEIDEYVLNEHGIIFKGSRNYIFPLDWDFGQFEDNMVEICLKMLDVNPKHILDPADDVSARCNPIYVGRVISAMINSLDDKGVVVGNWDGDYEDGERPNHWTGSHAILQRWFDSGHVKYGQCWVFAGVMCSVMRLLGVPCRVVSNFDSAHDNDRNLTIDIFHPGYGVEEVPSYDSVWNFHVWVEAWMRRPDLLVDGKYDDKYDDNYDGWQVLDPTPQEKSEGVYCCGPASLKSILNGQTDVKYDVPFVYAEVNADCIDWLVKADGSKLKVVSDTKKVGHNISTKAVGSDKREDITHTYKHEEGSEKERSVFEYARTRDYSRVDEEDEDEEEDEEDEDMEEGEEEENIGVEEVEEDEGNVEMEEEDEDDDDDDEESPDAGPPEPTPPEVVHMRFEEVTPPMNGKNVRLKLVLKSASTINRPLLVDIRVAAMRYNGTVTTKIQNEVKEKTLLPRKDLRIPIRVPFSVYHKHMLASDCMNFSVVVTDKKMPDYVYLAEDDVVLIDPPITIKLPKWTRRFRTVQAEVVFNNPANETLTKCSLTFSGSGLVHDELKIKLPDLKKNNRLRVMVPITPYKAGKKTLLLDFDCATFRDIKGKCTINVRKGIF
ncbi:protein-glutamine gamma-glutamyltransferase E-like [Clinocottus analis]|uniref:protein-glutamine gamma-glutamyltransferase E-like n=1 Tax=Clinocottus analis TaxID=304258 RepID=UPI0035C238C0